MQRHFDLEERLIDFSVLVISLTQAMPKTYAAEHLTKQLIRSGTAPALIYGEAQAAESPADFIHKMKLSLKELRETQINIKIMLKSKLVADQALITPCLVECGELVAIFTKSVKTAMENSKTKPNNKK